MARFTPAWLDELRARSTLSAVIARDIALTRAGREHKACCPFHGEKTPSFTVNDDKGFYHCFGCGAHGDAIRWLTDHRGLPFVEAIEELAGDAGMEVPAPSAEAQRAAARIAGQRPTLEAAAAIYRDLLRGDAGAAAWLASRGIAAASEAEFGLGLAPENGALRDRGFNRADLIAVGLVGAAEGRAGAAPFYYPRFRSRIMIPIHDARGQIVGFGGRTFVGSPVPGEAPPPLPGAKPESTFAEGAGRRASASSKHAPAKYINSPDSAIFDKGALLFNLHRAREAYRSTSANGAGWRGTGRLIIAEGYFDVVALHRLGLAAVAPMGTALTDRQLERAWRVDPCPLLLFDGDAAGMKAAVRACETALPMLGPGRSLSVGTLPEGMDPDELVQAAARAGEDPGMALAVWLMANAPMTLQECLLNHALEQVDGSTPEAWAAVWQRLQAWASAIACDDTRALTLMHWRRRWEVAAELIADIPVTVRLVPVAVDDDWACDECGLATDPQAGCLKVGHCPHRDGSTFETAMGLDWDDADARVQGIVMWLTGAFDDIADIQDDIKFRLSMAKEMGFDPPMLRKMARAVIADRDKPDTRVLKEAREVAYRRAIGLPGPMTDAMLPPPFASGPALANGKAAKALPPPTRQIEAMMDMIEGRG